MLRKFLSVVILTAAGAFFAVSMTNAQSIQDLQAQIQSLLNQVSQLQAQLGTLEQSGSVTQSPTAACTYTRNLYLGITGDDVRCLQQHFNALGFTIASTGPGSPGNETNYFGSLTKTAVVTFQNKYVSEILHPLSLTEGTGYFGSSTRWKLNSLLTEISVSDGGTGEENGETTEPSPPAVVPSPIINSISPSVAKRGDRITILGSGFTSSNQVRLTFGILQQDVYVASLDGTTLSFTLAVPVSLPVTETILNLLPEDERQKLNSILEANNATIDDLNNPYQGVSREQLEQSLSEQGFSLVDLRDPFAVVVVNENGTAQSAIMVERDNLPL